MSHILLHLRVAGGFRLGAGLCLHLKSMGLFSLTAKLLVDCLILLKLVFRLFSGQG